MDLNSPGEEHKKLEMLAGEWEVIVRFPAGPGRRMDGKSSLVAKWDMDGRFMRQEYTSIFMGKPLTVIRYVGFDRHKGKFVEIQFESTHTDVMHNEGTISADGKTITSFGSHVDTAAGKEVKVRSVTTFVDKDTFTTEAFYNEGSADAKEITLIHKRKEKNERTSAMKLYRVILQVADLDKGVKFYSTLLYEKGRSIRGGRHYFDCGPVILALLDPTGGGETAKPNADNIYFAVEDIEKVHARASALNCLSKENIDGAPAGDIVKRPWGERSFYVIDPWGNRLCFVDAQTIFTGK